MTDEQKALSTFGKWDLAHKNALSEVQRALQGAPELAALTAYLMETDANPYGFMPKGWEGAAQTSTGFAAFLGVLHHALYDDGDISFPIVNGGPRIAFVWQREHNYAELVLSDTEKSFRREHGSTYEITFAAGALDFIERHRKHHSKEVREWFIEDAARHSVGFAVSVYQKYANFSWGWEEDPDVLQEIEARRGELKRLGVL